MASGEKMDPASVMPPKKSVMPPTGRPASASEVKSDDSLEVFVTLVMVRVFEKCDTFENCSQKAWGPHLKHLVTQTMQGLIVEKGFWFNRKTIQSVCQAVVKDLQSKFGGKFKLQCALLFRDPGMDHVIIHVVQAHIRELSERLSRKKYRSWKSEFKLWALAFLYFSVYIIAIALSFFIPFF